MSFILCVLKRLLKIFRNTLFVLVGLLACLAILVNIAPVQNYLSKEAASFLSKKLNTKVSVEHFRVHLFNRADLEGLYIADQHNDTLLYAGVVKIRISDWVFSGKEKHIHFIGLKNASVYLHRYKNTDEWNYAFLQKVFRSASGENTDSSHFHIRFSLKKLHLQNVHFYRKDEWVGTDYEAYIGDFLALPKSIDFKNKTVKIALLKGENLLFGISQYTGGRPTGAHHQVFYPPDTTPFNPNHWRFSVTKLKINKGRFYLNYPEETAPKGLFDADHLDIRGINTEIRNIKIINDTIFGHVVDLAAKERCGLQIKKMHADVRVSPTLASCTNLFLQTNNSTVTDYYAMRYSRFPDFIDYIDKVKMTAHLKNAKIGLRDIAYFAPELNRFDKLSVHISGKGSGTVNRLSAKNIRLNDGHTTLSGSLILNGLPDIAHTFIDFRNVNLITSGAAILSYAPELSKQNAVHLQALSSIKFLGNYTGFIRNFVTSGIFKTNLGGLDADLNMKIPANSKAQYSGHLSATNFACGQLLNQSLIGKTSFSLQLNGIGFNPKTLSAKLKGKITNIAFKNYAYKHIAINGSFNKEIFDGKLNSKDPNADFDFNGMINFTKTAPIYHFDAAIRQLNLKALNFSNDNISIQSVVNIDMKGENIDKLTGQAVMKNLYLKLNGKRLNAHSIFLSSQINAPGGLHKITFKTDSVSLNIEGNFNPSDFLNDSRMFLSYYLPDFITPPDDFGHSRNFHFVLRLQHNTSGILALISPKLKLKGKANLSGFVDLEHQSLQLTGNFKKLAFGNIRSENMTLTGKGNFDHLLLNVDAQNIHDESTNILSDLQISGQLFRDSVHYAIETTSPTTFSKAFLNGIAFARQDSLFLKFRPSKFNFNKTVWKIPTGNAITLAKNYISIQNLKIFSGNQQLEINPEGEAQLKNNAIIKIKNVDLSPLNSFIDLNGNKLGGIANGIVYAKNLSDSTRLDFAITTNHTTLQDEKLGTTNLNGYYLAAKKLLHINKNSGIQYQNAQLSLWGNVNMNPKKETLLSGKITLSNAKLSWLSPFFEGVVHDVNGVANGYIALSGEASAPNTKGDVHVSNATFTPDITGVQYHIPNSNIRINNSYFILDSAAVFDAAGNKGSLSGNVSHKGLSNFYFNLHLTGNSLRVIHQNKNQNKYFYGNVLAKVNTTLRGPWDDLTMHAILSPSRHSSLFITVDNSDVYSGNYNYISFRQSNAKKQRKRRVGQGAKFNFILDAVVSPNLETTLILDPETNERMWAKGSGNITLKIPSEGDMQMNGSYIISEGKYNFSFRQLQILNYKREFIIDPNSSIKWNGDITDADLDVTAHTTVRARLYDLISGEKERLNLSNEEIHDAQLRQNINVLMTMKGSLDKPDLTFKIKLPEGRSVGTYAYQKLQRINTNEKQTLIQVTSLLLLGQFVPPEGINNNALSSGTINNMSELFSAAASSQLSNFANKLLGMKDLSIGVKYKNYSLSQVNQLNNINYLNRNEAKLNVRKNFLNDRLIVEVGGAYDWGQAGTAGNFTSNLAGDFSVQYLLTADGRVRFSIFRTSDYDPLYSLKPISRQGVNLSYRKSFNNPKELFSKTTKEAARKLRQPHRKDNREKSSDPFREKVINPAEKKTKQKVGKHASLNRQQAIFLF